MHGGMVAQNKYTRSGRKPNRSHQALSFFSCGFLRLHAAKNDSLHGSAKVGFKGCVISSPRYVLSRMRVHATQEYNFAKP